MSGVCSPLPLIDLDQKHVAQITTILNAQARTVDLQWCYNLVASGCDNSATWLRCFRRVKEAAERYPLEKDSVYRQPVVRVDILCVMVSH